jgi:hypothetical protein
MLGDVPPISIQDFSLFVTYLLQVLMLKETIHHFRHATYIVVLTKQINIF